MEHTGVMGTKMPLGPPAHVNGFEGFTEGLAKAGIEDRGTARLFRRLRAGGKAPR